MINWSDVAPEHRTAYYEWHSREHMVGRVAIPGYQRGRRYLAVEAERDFLVLYEVDDLAVVTGPAYMAKANKPSPLTQRTAQFVKNAVRGLAVVRASFGIGTGGYALTLRFDPRAGGESALAGYLTGDALPRAAERPDITGRAFPRRGQGGEQYRADGAPGTPDGHSQLDRPARRRLARCGQRRLRGASVCRSAAPARRRRCNRAGYLLPAAHGAAAGRLRGTLKGHDESQRRDLLGRPLGLHAPRPGRHQVRDGHARRSLFRGKPLSPGFTRIIEPATIISVMLVLEDGQIALRRLRRRDTRRRRRPRPGLQRPGHIDYVREEVADALRGRDVSKFKDNAAEMDRYARGGARLHTAIRYGVSQALLHATALAHRQTMAEVIAREYGSTIATAPIPILASCHKDDPGQLDRVILKRVELLPHASFQVVSEHVGLQGEKLAAFVRRVAQRIGEIGDADYRPRIHVDLYGTLGELFSMKIEPLADYLGRLRGESGAYQLLVESPMIARTQEEQIEKFRGLRELLGKKGIDVRLIADEWCNTLDDIRLFAAGARRRFRADQDAGPGQHPQHDRGRALLQVTRHGGVPGRHRQRDRSLDAHLDPHRPRVPAGLHAIQARAGRRRGADDPDQRNGPHARPPALWRSEGVRRQGSGGSKPDTRHVSHVRLTSR